MKTKIFAHRGASLTHPENTLEAFREAVRLGVDGIELDVQRTADRQLVVLHDEELTRLTGQPGYVHEMSLEALQSMNIAHHAGAFAVAPTLESVFRLLSSTDLQLNVELKNSIVTSPGMEEEVIELVSHFNLSDRVIYSSFNHLSMKRFADLGLGEQSALLFSDWIYRPWDYAALIGVSSLHPSYNVLQYPNLIKVCRDNGIAVRTWTVDTPAHMDLVLALEPDAMITNDPTLAMERRSQWEINHAT